MPISNVQNRNFQTPLNYELRVDRLTDFNFYVQKVNIPSVTLPPSGNAGANPFVKVPYPGDHLDYSELSVEFKISEGLYNWYEIYSWMQSLGFPENQKQYGDFREGTYKDLNNNPVSRPIKKKAVANVFGLATLLIHTSQNNPYLKINFIDIWPTNLSEVSFDTRDQDTIYLTSTVSFKYSYFTVEKLT